MRSEEFENEGGCILRGKSGLLVFLYRTVNHTANNYMKCMDAWVEKECMNGCMNEWMERWKSKECINENI